MMNATEKISILARGRGKRKKGKSKASTGRSGMLKVVMPYLSGDRGDKLTSAITGGNPDKAKAIWSSIGDDLYQAVEMIRDENASKARKDGPKPKAEDYKPEQSPSSKGSESS